MKVDALGVDIGGVIIDKINDRTDTSFFTGNYLATTPVPGVFDALARLVEKKFGDQVYLVSYCSKQSTEDKSLEWLPHHRFYERTGISPDHVRFCRERRGKAAIATELGLTHFIDDRLEILSYLEDVPNLYLFQPFANEIRRYRQHLHRVRILRSWSEAPATILGQAA